MDQELIRFRQAADRENGARRGLRRRYSPTLQQHAVDYWQRRRQQGDGVRPVAAALGVAPWSLHRWIRATKPRPRFRAVHVVASASSPRSGVTVTLTADGPRVDGLDVDAAARLLSLLR